MQLFTKLFCLMVLIFTTSVKLNAQNPEYKGSFYSGYNPNCSNYNCLPDIIAPNKKMGYYRSDSLMIANNVSEQQKISFYKKSNKKYEFWNQMSQVYDSLGRVTSSSNFGRQAFMPSKTLTDYSVPYQVKTFGENYDRIYRYDSNNNWIYAYNENRNKRGKISSASIQKYNYNVQGKILSYYQTQKKMTPL